MVLFFVNYKVQQKFVFRTTPPKTQNENTNANLWLTNRGLINIIIANAGLTQW